MTDLVRREVPPCDGRQFGHAIVEFQQLIAEASELAVRLHDLLCACASACAHVRAHVHAWLSDATDLGLWRSIGDRDFDRENNVIRIAVLVTLVANLGRPVRARHLQLLQLPCGQLAV